MLTSVEIMCLEMQVSYEV